MKCKGCGLETAEDSICENCLYNNSTKTSVILPPVKKEKKTKR